MALVGTINAPNDFGFKNRIINGDMRIDQRNAGANVAVTTSDTYVTDRFAPHIFGSGTGRFTAQQVSTVPTGFAKSLQLTVTTTDASPAAGYGYCIQQRIEGYNVVDLLFGSASAQTVTLSFWVRSSVTGSFGFLLHNASVTRNYGVLYTISAANTWEQKTITIAGDTTGTWETTNLNGLGVTFCLGGGSIRTVSTGWNANATGSTPSFVTGGTNLMATNGATFYITGVQLEKGSTATSFDYRPYGTELALCQRYFEKSFNQSTAPAQNVGGTGAFRFVQVVSINTRQRSCGTAFLKVTKRANPTVTLFNPEAANSLPRNSQRALDWTTGGLGQVGVSESVLTFSDWTSASSGGAGDDFTVQWTASSEL